MRQHLLQITPANVDARPAIKRRELNKEEYMDSMQMCEGINVLLSMGIACIYCASGANSRSLEKTLQVHNVRHHRVCAAANVVSWYLH